MPLEATHDHSGDTVSSWASRSDPPRLHPLPPHELHRPVRRPHRWRADLDQERGPAGSEQADRALHRGRRHGARHLARHATRARGRGRQGVRLAPGPLLDGGLRGRQVLRPLRQLAAGRDAGRVPEVPGGHQGPPHDAGRRGHPLAQRGAATDPRPVRVPAARALVPRRSLAHEEPAGRRHGDLPREHGGHLRRHRVPGGQPGERALPQAVRGGLPRGVPEDPLPRQLRHRAEARLARGQRAPGAPRCATPWTRSARASPWCTRATS